MANKMAVTALPPRTLEEIETLQKDKTTLANSAKQAENRKFVGNLRKKEPGAQGADKFHLPVLHINDPTQWPSQPISNRMRLTDEVAYKTCLGNCCGVPGLKARCCQIDPDDMEHVLGPLDEVWIKTIISWLRKKGMTASRADIVIDFEEGRIIGEKFFNGDRKAVFQSPESYPMLRFQVSGPRFSCKFLSPTDGKCTIYEQRPDMCRSYLCQYLRANFLVRTPDKPNTYQKLR